MAQPAQQPINVEELLSMYIFLVTLASNNLAAGARQLNIDHIRKIPYAILNTTFDPYNRSQGIQNQI